MRGGAGGVFRRTEAEGEGGSGVLPRDSLSKTDSRSDSWDALFGAGGRGLLRSVLERLGGEEVKNGAYCECEDVAELGVGGCGDTNGIFMEDASSRSSTLMSLPCLELGGGGAFRADVGEEISVVTARRSSSGSEISWDVRGVSVWLSCIGSNIDCRDTDDVSVLLPPSPNPGCICAGDAVGGVTIPRPAFPVMSNLLNASTSIDALPGLVMFGGEIAVCSRPGFSIVSNVFENGFNGACVAGLTSSSSERSDVVLSNGSSSRGIGVGGFIS